MVNTTYGHVSDPPRPPGPCACGPTPMFGAVHRRRNRVPGTTQISADTRTQLVSFVGNEAWHWASCAARRASRKLSYLARSGAIEDTEDEEEEAKQEEAKQEPGTGTRSQGRSQGRNQVSHKSHRHCAIFRCRGTTILQNLHRLRGSNSKRQVRVHLRHRQWLLLHSGWPPGSALSWEYPGSTPSVGDAPWVYLEEREPGVWMITHGPSGPRFHMLDSNKSKWNFERPCRKSPDPTPGH